MIQYPKNVHTTLPSVESGFGTLNILRDPPKSVYTKYNPKVGDTSQITEWVGDSGDRICESIKVYARGVNPMVSVDYGNNGSNGGQVRYRGGAMGIGQNPISSGQSFLPYRVMREGAFRPPIIPPEELLPLSRLPRLPTTHQTNPGSERSIFNDMTKCKTDLRAIRNELLKVCAAPTAIFNIETPASQPYEVKNMIGNKVKTTGSTNKNGKKYTLGINTNPERGIKTEKNTLYGSIPSNLNKNIQATPLAAYCGNQPLPIQERVRGSCSTNASAGEKQNYIHAKLQLDRNRPAAAMSVNPGQRGVDVNNNINARQYKNLSERRSRGGFENAGFQQSGVRDQPVCNLSGAKSVYQQAAQSMSSRNNNPYR